MGILQAEPTGQGPGDIRTADAEIRFIDRDYSIDRHAETMTDHQDLHAMPDGMPGIRGRLGGYAVIDGTRRVNGQPGFIRKLDLAAGDPWVPRSGGAEENPGISTRRKLVFAAKEEVLELFAKVQP